MEYNAVFEGGGVRGIAHVGAACVLEEAGYRLGFFACLLYTSNCFWPS